MIRYYTSRTLSQKLNINLAKWKRWSREFLPPDPLGGQQSGYARQYPFRDVFAVYLGGYLVGNLNMSIPDSKMVLSRILEWMAENKILMDTNNSLNGISQDMVSGFQGLKLVVQTDSRSIVHYFIHQTLGSKQLDLNDTASFSLPVASNPDPTSRIVEEVYSEACLMEHVPALQNDSEGLFPVSEKVLYISSVMMGLLRKLEL